MACASISSNSLPAARGKPLSRNYVGGKFRNTQPTQEVDFMQGMKSFWRVYTQKPSDSVPTEALEIQSLTQEDLRKAPDLSLWRLGHSTLLMKLDGKYWLTDPVFSDRASPFSFAGPKRFHSLPIARDDLPEIEAVILSHDHYDHLDYQTILALAPKVKHFLSPLGVGDRLIGWGIPASKVQQFDWWEETQIGSVKVIATPAQHFSGRGLAGRDSTLWASWVLITPKARLFFSGDTGYFDGFKVVGERFGPFDITLLENGAYNQGWADIHMHPEETVQAHIDLRGKQLVPIHNGTFDLSLHGWTNPFERVAEFAKQRSVSLSTPRMGERLDILHPAKGMAWWRTAEPNQEVARAKNALVQ